MWSERVISSITAASSPNTTPAVSGSEMRRRAGMRASEAAGKPTRWAHEIASRPRIPNITNAVPPSGGSWRPPEGRGQ
jgi:hypothetical protein